MEIIRNIEKLYSILDIIKNEKLICVHSQDYETAATLRSLEKILLDFSFDNYDNIFNFVKDVFNPDRILTPFGVRVHLKELIKKLERAVKLKKLKDFDR